MVQLQGKDLRYRNVVISNVLNDRGEEACAVIAVQLSNEYVNRLIANLQLEAGARILIYNANGIVGSNFDTTGQAALAELLESVGWKDEETVQFDGVTYGVHARYSPQYGLTFPNRGTTTGQSSGCSASSGSPERREGPRMIMTRWNTASPNACIKTGIF